MKNSGNIRKEVEFAEFLRTIEGGAMEHWTEIAKAIGVDKDTITEWKKLPEAKEAIRKGIRKSIEGMERSGRADWRMWREKAKMLGVNDIDKSEVEGSLSFIVKRGE